MGEFQRRQASAGLYSRLLQRLTIALDDAQSVQGLATTEPQELELRGLTAAEHELISAYLARDSNWLRGWHAAAAELSAIERYTPRTARLKLPTRALARPKSIAARHSQLCCALCGCSAHWQSFSSVRDCRYCGSKLFRVARQVC
ncbi:hypothetical protein [Pseudomonas sp. EL_65y_Pfl2_R95]|uniref:hypothetical protein n=1 Tax=Pseudomonas sp. EL_65y_Pfl2_R95 TaxID=3088698 RepID=UPI0030D95C02